MIGKVAKVESVVKFAQTLPQTLYMAKSYIGLGRDEFEKSVVCPKCCALYKTEECTVRKSNGRVVSKKCPISESSPENPKEAMWCTVNEANAIQEWICFPLS